MSAIGVGDLVQFVGHERPWWKIWEPSYKRGDVRIISSVAADGAPCDDCDDRGAGFNVSSDPPGWRRKWDWCPCAWKPYHGEEKDARRTCEEITS